ncbi:hypothetical protein BG015_001120 [Linnemannia schmuckeri]|uniref:Uncharacterized protein n=1 Tax=Linnemannia schmuckeri TaxID=64567 RepID=A0A9P5S9T1_9FUNG|nr:hypothetical protein BG015_001120 [Linnemannia schmuckeri]
MFKFTVRGQRVDASSMDSIFNCISQQVSVTVLDVNQAEYKAGADLGNDEFLECLKQPRPDWSAVRLTILFTCAPFGD